MNSSSNSKEINPDVKKEEVNSKKLKRKKRQYLQNKRKREKGGESDYVIFNRNNNKIIRQNGIDYHPIKYVRDSSEGNIRTKKFNIVVFMNNQSYWVKWKVMEDTMLIIILNYYII
jgi:hypothetical protein